MEDTTAPLQRQKRSRSASEHDEAGDTGVARGRGSSQPATSIDDAVADPSAFTDDGTTHALQEIDFFYDYPRRDDGGRGATAGLFAADQEHVDVALTLGCKGPFVAGPKDTVDATLRLGLGPPHSAAPHVAAALGEDEDKDPKLDDPFWYPLPFAADDDPCNAPPPSPEDGGTVVVVPPDDAFHSFVLTRDDGFAEFVTDDATDRPYGSTVLDLNQPCSSEFSDDIIAGDVDDERPGRETTAEQRHQSSTPYTFI